MMNCLGEASLMDSTEGKLMVEDGHVLIVGVA